MSRTCRVNRTLTNSIALVLGALGLLANSLALASAPANTPLNPALVAAQWPASWIASASVPGGDPGVFYFRREITLSSVPAHFWVHISADNRFLLHVNGKYAAEGPARGDLFHWRFETVDLAPLLQPGTERSRCHRLELRRTRSRSPDEQSHRIPDARGYRGGGCGEHWQGLAGPAGDWSRRPGARRCRGVLRRGSRPKRSMGACSIGPGISPEPTLPVGRLRACWTVLRRARPRIHPVIGNSFRIHFHQWSIDSSMQVFPFVRRGCRPLRHFPPRPWRFRPTRTLPCSLTIALSKPLTRN